DVTDGNATAPALRLRLPAHLVEMHPGGIEVEVEVEIDVEIEGLGDREDAGDLLVRLGVRIGTSADELGPLLARGDQKLLGARIVDQAFLRKHANLEIDRPRIIALEPRDRVEAAEPDARIDLDMRAHARRALHDRLLERAAPARIDVLLGEIALGG